MARADVIRRFLYIAQTVVLLEILFETVDVG
jgi:hypothetical protein